MSRFANAKGAAFQTLDKLTDLLLLSMLFLLCCIPVVTIGASFTALYYTINKVYLHDRGYMWQEFFGAFRKNFRDATLSWIVFLAAGAVLAGDLFIVIRYMKNSAAAGFLNLFFLVLFALLVMWGSYVFPYISRFQDTVKVTLKNSALIALINLPKSLLLLLILALAAAAVYVFFPLAVIVPAAAVKAMNSVLEPVFRKYMTDEDKAAEDDQNQEWPDQLK